MSNIKTAVVYYSYSGNIRKIANMINEIADVDLYEIKALEEYPQNINDLIPIAKHEVDNKTGRDIHTVDINLNDYNNIILCTPNWGNTLAPPMLTFLRNYDVSDKNIFPVITHEGTGKGHIIRDIKKETGNSKVKNEFVDFHKRTTNAQLEDWLNSLSI